MERFHDAGITIIPVIPSVALAKRVEKLGANAVVAEVWKLVVTSVEIVNYGLFISC